MSVLLHYTVSLLNTIHWSISYIKSKKKMDYDVVVKQAVGVFHHAYYFPPIAMILLNNAIFLKSRLRRKQRDQVEAILTERPFI